MKQEGLEKLFNHVVQIQVVIDFPKAKNEEPPYVILSASAFVIEIRGCWFLVSAGHVVNKDLREVVKRNGRIRTCQLLDNSLQKKHSHPIPFPIFDASEPNLIANGVPAYILYESGYDFLVIGLQANQIDLLTAGDVTPLDENFWQECPAIADEYYLVGAPYSFRQRDEVVTSSRVYVNGQQGTMAVQVHPCDAPERLTTEFERFYAKVPLIPDVWNGDGFENIEGMSGGPIFACLHEGDFGLRYYLFAVQSGWQEKSRIITACPLKTLLATIANSEVDPKSWTVGDAC